VTATPPEPREPRGRRLLRLLPWIVLVLIVAADVVGSRIVVSGSYPTAAVIASTAMSVRRTATIAGVSVGCAAMSWIWNDHPGPADLAARVVLAAALGAIAVVAARIRVRRERDLEEMTLVALTVQQSVLRTIPREVDGTGFAARYVSATRAALVGGDLFDVVHTNQGVRVVVGDARGKGLEAVQLAGTVLAAFRRAAFEQAGLGEVASRLDEVVRAVGTEEDFVTALLVELGPDGTLSLVSCGHHPPLLLPSGDDGPRSVLVDTGPPQRPLGLGVTGAVETTAWTPGSRLLLYTDGLVEARDGSGAFFPLPTWAPTLASAGLDEALERLLSGVREFVGGEIGDDIALLLVENRGRP